MHLPQGMHKKLPRRNKILVHRQRLWIEGDSPRRIPPFMSFEQQMQWPGPEPILRVKYKGHPA